MNKELVKIDESISRLEKVLDSATDRLEPTHPPTKRIERKISELNRKIRRAKKNKVKEERSQRSSNHQKRSFTIEISRWEMESRSQNPRRSFR